MSRNRYTPAEDNAILDFVEKNKDMLKVGGNKLWKKAESESNIAKLAIDEEPVSTTGPWQSGPKDYPEKGQNRCHLGDTSFRYWLQPRYMHLLHQCYSHCHRNTHNHIKNHFQRHWVSDNGHPQTVAYPAFTNGHIHIQVQPPKQLVADCYSLH